MTPEKRVQNSLMSYMSKLETDGHPIFFERRQAGGFSYKMGIPDLYAVYDGQHIEIEVKAPGCNLRPMQIKFKQQCEQKNILYICCSDLQDLRQFFINEFFGCSHPPF